MFSAPPRAEPLQGSSSDGPFSLAHGVRGQCVDGRATAVEPGAQRPFPGILARDAAVHCRIRWRPPAGLRIPSALPARRRALRHRAARVAGSRRAWPGTRSRKGGSSLFHRGGQGRRTGAFHRRGRRGRAAVGGRARLSRHRLGRLPGLCRQEQRALLAARAQREHEHEHRTAREQDCAARRAAGLR